MEAALKARQTWGHFTMQERVAVFLKAAALLAGPWRQILNATTMLGQSKTMYQAEIDSACELIDFLRFNCRFALDIAQHQPNNVDPNQWNYVTYRPLEGIVYAVTPFNFTAIGGNLPTAPAIMGNVVLWKPSHTSVYSNYYFCKLLHEAGLPPGVINFVPGDSALMTKMMLGSPHFAGIHYTGSTDIFHQIWKQIGENIAIYRSYPRVVGETGGKDFIFAHNSANPHELVTAIIRGAFEYAGQKCSAASRGYLPRSTWPNIKALLLEKMSKVKMGNPEDPEVFVNAVIHISAFKRCMSYIDFAKKSNNCTIICGGEGNDSVGYFVQPTIIETSDPHSKLMQDEIFGPIMTLYVYDDDKYEETLRLCDQCSTYALTGAIWATDRAAITLADKILENAAGNFYINDKPTGAVVSQQPFGGGRASGTNDKAGSYLNLLRWVSCRSVKENFLPATELLYTYMKE